MDNILNEIKNNMKDAIEKIDAENLKEISEELNKYFKMIHFMLGLESEKAPTITSEQPKEEVKEEPREELVEDREESPVKFKINKKTKGRKPEVEEEAEDNSPIDELAKVFDKEKRIPGYEFERKLSGGILLKGNIQENIFVPESVIRTLGLESGDIVSAELQNGSTRYNQRFDYHVVERATQPKKDNIHRFAYGIVKYDASIDSFYVEENIYKESLRIDEAPMRYIARSDEEESFNLTSGDIVDVSWYEGSFDKAKINWRYNTDEVPQSKTIEKRQLIHKRTKKETVSATPNLTLKGKTICLIGLEPKWAKYKKLIEDHGGEILLVESKRHKVSRSASIRKSDIVVVGISHTSHDASIHAAQKAKDYNVKFEAIEGYGGNTFLQTVYDGLGIKETANA